MGKPFTERGRILYIRDAAPDFRSDVDRWHWMDGCTTSPLYDSIGPYVSRYDENVWHWMSFCKTSPYEKKEPYRQKPYRPNSGEFCELCQKEEEEHLEYLRLKCQIQEERPPEEFLCKTCLELETRKDRIETYLRLNLSGKVPKKPTSRGRVRVIKSSAPAKYPKIITVTPEVNKVNSNLPAKRSDDDWVAEFDQKLAELKTTDFGNEMGLAIFKAVGTALSGKDDDAINQLSEVLTIPQQKEVQIVREYLVLMRRDRMDLFRHWTSKYPQLLNDYKALLDNENQLIEKEHKIIKTIGAQDKPRTSKTEANVKIVQEFTEAVKRIKAMFPNDPDKAEEFIEKLKSDLFEGEE